MSTIAATLPARAASPERVRCVQCALPVRGTGVRLPIDGVPQPFCCYGCYIVLRFTNEPGASGQAQGLFLRLGLALFFSMNAMMFSLPGYFPYVYGGEFGGEGFLLFLRLAALLLTLPVLALFGVPVAWQAIRDARQWTMSTDALIALGTFAAFGVSVANTIHGAPHVYFDTIGMLLTLVAIGRYLEARGKADTGEILKNLTDAQARRARVEREREVLDLFPSELRVGDVVWLGPGDVCPVDGIIVSGRASFDEATLTGESHPQAKHVGHEVMAGTTNLDGELRVRARRVGADSTLGRLHRLVEDTLADKSDLQRLADRMAAAFMPMVLSLAAATFAFWWWREGTDAALLHSLSVLVVACPCAFGIATPAAVWIGIGEAGRRGILLKSADLLEALARVRTLWLDKTGTLTTGRMTYQGMTLAPGRSEGEENLLRLARSLEALVPHPVAVALLATGNDVDPVHDLRYHAGMGVEGSIRQRRWRLGSVAFVYGPGQRGEEWVQAALTEAGASGCGAVVLSEPGVGGAWQAVAVMRFSDPLRPDANQVVEKVRSLGVGLGVLSGGSQTASLPGIADTSWHVGLLPSDKANWIAESRRGGLVAMVGDGLNDAPAFATADIGIALGTGRDLVREAANINVLSNDLAAVPWLIEWSRRVRRTVIQNLAWASGYNALALVAAVTGWLNPVIAALAMIFSSVMILANARRLRSRA